MSEFLVKYNIKHLLAQDRKKEGSKNVLSRSTKKLDEFLQNTWWIKEATEVLDRAKTSRMEILRNATEEDCAQQCEGMCLQHSPVRFSCSAARSDRTQAGKVQKYNDHRPGELWEKSFYSHRYKSSLKNLVIRQTTSTHE